MTTMLALPRMLYVLLIVFVIPINTYSADCDIDAKTFLFDFLNEKRYWEVKRDSYEHIAPILDIEVDINGSVWVRTYDAKFFPAFVGIFNDSGTSRVRLSRIKYNIGSSVYEKELKQYDMRDVGYTLRPSEDYCLNGSIILTIEVLDENGKIKERTFYFDKK